MKIERSDIRVSKLNDAELIVCLENCLDTVQDNLKLCDWIRQMIYFYDPQTRERTLEPNRYSLQLALDGLTHKVNPEILPVEYVKSEFTVPLELKTALQSCIKEKESNQAPFLYFDRIDYDEDGEKYYTPCVYRTQEDFFKALNDLYENNIDRYYNSPEKILGTNLKENQEFLHANGQEVTIGSEVEDIRINGNRFIENTDIYTMINEVCNNYRDTEIYPWIPGIKEIDIENGNKNEVFTMPGGIETSFQEIQNHLDREYARSDLQFPFYAGHSVMVNPPTNENESDWKIINYLGRSENDFNDKGIFILKNNEPVHAFLIGSENLYTQAEEELLKNLAEDYIVKQVYYKEQTPMRINMEKYELMGQVLTGNGMRAFTVPVSEILHDQERIREKNQVILNIPEKPSLKDFAKDLKNLMIEYEKKGISEKNLRQALTKIFTNDNGKGGRG